MKDHSAYLPQSPSGFHELPLVLLFSFCLSATLVAILTLPFRFALVSSAGMALFGVSCFVKDKRMFYLSLMTLALILPTNKRIFEIHTYAPSAVDVVDISLIDAFLFISYLIWFFTSRRSARPERVLRKTIVLPFLVFCGASLLSFANSSKPVWGLFELVRMAKTLALYGFLIYNIRDLKEVRRIIVFLGIGLLIEFTFCIVEKYVFHGSLGLKYLGETEQSINSIVADRLVFRSGGTFGHPNALAYYVDLLIPFMLTRVFALRSTARARFYYGMAFAAACGCLFFAQSRGSMIANGITVTFCFMVLVWRNIRLKIFPVLTVGVIMAVIGVVGIFHQKIFDRFGKNDAGAFQTRLDQYHVAYRMALAHPWIGVGLNTYIQTSPAYDNTPAKVTRSFPEPVHNMYLLALTETGLIGLAGVFWLIVAILRMAQFWRWPYGDMFDLHLGLFFSLVGFFIHANGDPQSVGNDVFLFFLVGLLTVVHNIGQAHVS